MGGRSSSKDDLERTFKAMLVLADIFTLGLYSKLPFEEAKKNKKAIENTRKVSEYFF
jgi:hypothetical protein